MAAAAFQNPGTRSGAALVLVLVVVTAVLYLARDVVIPLALAILLRRRPAPAAGRLERWGLGRVPATAVVVTLRCSIGAAVGWVAAQQAVSLPASVPEYRENISGKIGAVPAPSDG